MTFYLFLSFFHLFFAYCYSSCLNDQNPKTCSYTLMLCLLFLLKEVADDLIDGLDAAVCLDRCPAEGVQRDAF